MQMEIKFRGKRVDTGEWVYGYYAENGEMDTRWTKLLNCVILAEKNLTNL